MLHAVFSAFDAAVLERGLFKMDTVGDAYIAAGFLPTETQHMLCVNTSAEARQVCENVLEVSRAMLRATERYRQEGGRDVHCRIGISMGSVVTGVLGQLQPRLHLFGEGMRAAESHEQTGDADAVHVNHAFMAALGRRISSFATTAKMAPVAEPANLPVSAETAALPVHSTIGQHQDCSLSAHDLPNTESLGTQISEELDKSPNSSRNRMCRRRSTDAPNLEGWEIFDSTACDSAIPRKNQLPRLPSKRGRRRKSFMLVPDQTKPLGPMPLPVESDCYPSPNTDFKS